MKFNAKAITARLLNHEGATAFALTPQMELYTLVAAATLNDQFYEKAEDKLNRLRQLIGKNDAGFKIFYRCRRKEILRLTERVAGSNPAGSTQK